MTADSITEDNEVERRSRVAEILLREGRAKKEIKKKVWFGKRTKFEVQTGGRNVP